ncbi:MAG: lysophospholipid acyltransferase family protein [Edaphocola sp.]
MKAVVFYISLPFIYLLSLLPFRAMYALSDAVFVLLYRLGGYRKKVVSENLRNAFPEKPEAERQAIATKFYRHLCDNLLESLKLLTISPKQLLRHCSFTPASIALFSRLAAEGKSAVLITSHYGNWEWAGSVFPLQMRQPLYSLYYPLENKYFDACIKKMRGRTGARLVAVNDTLRTMIANKNEASVTVFLGDQTPSNANAYWTQFLNQDTPIFWGPEKIARKLNQVVVYGIIRKKKRGFYEVETTLLEPEPRKLPEGQLSEMHTRKLEQDIKAQPEFWLWSHRRWKRKRMSHRHDTGG